MKLRSRFYTSCIITLLASLMISACGGGGGSDKESDTEFTVTANATAGGTIAPSNATVADGDTTSFNITLDTGFDIDSVSGCGGSLVGNSYTTTAVTADCTVSATFSAITHTVSTSAGTGGTIDPSSVSVPDGDSTSFTITPDTGFNIDSASGCGGSLVGNSYTTAAVTADCTVSSSFSASTHTVSTSAKNGGTIDPSSVSVTHGDTTSFTITPDTGFNIDSVSGCDGSLVGNSYTTGEITANCTVSVVFRDGPVTAATPVLNYVSVKTFRFAWNDVSDAIYYKLLENPDGISGFTQVGNDIPQKVETFDHIVPLYARLNASYILQSCNADGCADSAAVVVSGSLLPAIGYGKASNSEAGDWFGRSVSLSDDGKTLAVGAAHEDSSATGVNGDETDNNAGNAGAVYVFTRSGASWSQQAYLKASNTEAVDRFGNSVSLSDDGNTLAVSANYEDSNATGVNGDETDNSAIQAGAVYVFTRSGASWSQQAYLKASNTEASDFFGRSVSLSDNGNTLAVGAYTEDSGIPGNPFDNGTDDAGAVYVFTRSGASWSQQAYLKASNTDADDLFGRSVSLSDDGNTLAVGAAHEDSSATGVNGDETDNSAPLSGAAYIFTRSGASWSQQAYLKASNTEAGDRFGSSVSLGDNGNALAVSANYEDSNATGVNGDETDNNATNAGAVYVFSRSGASWSQQAYLKTSKSGAAEQFGNSVSLSDDGDTLAVGAYLEASSATGVNGDETDNSTDDAGAVYVFTRSGTSWSQQAYLKASNTEAFDGFGNSVSLGGDGDTLAVGAEREDSSGTGFTADPSDNSATDTGAIYLY